MSANNLEHKEKCTNKWSTISTFHTRERYVAGDCKCPWQHIRRSSCESHSSLCVGRQRKLSKVKGREIQARRETPTRKASHLKIQLDRLLQSRGCALDAKLGVECRAQVVGGVEVVICSRRIGVAPLPHLQQLKRNKKCKQ